MVLSRGNAIGASNVVHCFQSLLCRADKYSKLTLLTICEFRNDNGFIDTVKIIQFYFSRLTFT